MHVAVNTNRRRWFLGVCFLSLALLLSSCFASGSNGTQLVSGSPIASQESATATSPSVLTQTATSSPDVSPTLVATHTPSGTMLPTPPFGQGKLNPDFLFDGQSADCFLPCWNGLKIGRSSVEEAQAIFVNTLGFESPPPLQDSNIDEYSIVKNRWWLYPNIPDRAEEDFFIRLWFDKPTNMLKGIELFGTSNQFEPNLSPAQVLRKLGTPSDILIDPIYWSEAPGQGGSALIIVYSRGIAFYYSLVVRTNSSEESKVTICLDNLAGLASTYYPFQVNVFLTDPIPTNVSDYDRVQTHLFGTQVRAFQPVQTMADVTVDEVTLMAQQQYNPCINVKNR